MDSLQLEQARIARDTVQMEIEGLMKMVDSLAAQAARLEPGSSARANMTQWIARLLAAMGCLAGNREIWPKVSGQALKLAHAEIRAAAER